MKTSVDVICMYPKNGLIRPLSIVWNNGASYPVKRITQVIPIDGDEGHSCSLRYTCRIGNSIRYLFLENGKWFIEKL